MLRERFDLFAHDTENIGTERVAAANEICDKLIDAEHTDADKIAQWKDNLNEAWQDLLEMIETRTQMIQASWELHKFYNDCKEILERIGVSLTSYCFVSGHVHVIRCRFCYMRLYVSLIFVNQ